MDTKLKKFNLSFLFKFVAVILCVFCIGGAAVQLLSGLMMAEERDLTEANFVDAFYMESKNSALYETNSFKREFERYNSKIAFIISTYGDGSEEAYQTMTDALAEENDEKFIRAKKNLVASVEQREGFFDYLVALSSGDIVNCGFVEAADEHDSDNFFYEEEIFDSDVDYEWISGKSFSADKTIYEVALTDEAREMLAQTKADGAVYLSSEAVVLDNNTEETVAEYPAGYYLFRVDENALLNNLDANGIFNHSSYESYDSFREAYENQIKYLEENYPSGRYYIRDALGNTYTNIEALSEKSTETEIAEAFDSLEFYACESDNMEMVLPDGRYYTGYSFVSELESEIFDEGVVRYYTESTTFTYPAAQTPSMPTTTLPDVTAETTAPERADEGITEETTAFPVTAPETSRNDYNGKSPFIVLTEKSSDIDAFVGVDMNSEAYKNNRCRFSQLNVRIVLARDIAKDTIRNCGSLAILFVILFIFLILCSGRRFGDRENVYMFRLDSMFTDWRIIFDCGVGILVFMLIPWTIDEFLFSANANKTVIIILGVLCATIGALVLDLVLFVTRHIKNRSLFRRLSLVWFVSKFSGILGKALKIKSKLLSILILLAVPVHAVCLLFVFVTCVEGNADFHLLIFPLLLLYDAILACLFVREKKWLSLINEKLLYVKYFGITTAIRAAIIIFINAVGIFFGSLEMVSNHTFFIAILLGLFDLVMLVLLFCFIGGVKKIFSALEEIQKGNYNVQINLFSLPWSLREPAKKLMSLRDGLKTAVDEAVKQEQTKTELITNVSHDLKTPLTSVINYVELLKKCNIDDEEAREYLDVLGEKSDRLKKLIEDLVEASKASTGNLKVELVDVSLNEITSQIIGEFSDNFDKKGLSLITSFPQENIIVRADSKMLFRVLENLMGNVSKYAMENTRVYLNVERRGGRGVISVKNISASSLNITAAQLKERFVRGDESRTTDGSGLGLSIAESLCALMGGKLNIIINGDLFVAEVII